MTRVVVILLLSALSLPAQMPYTPDLDLTEKHLVAAFSSAPLMLDPREAFGAQDLVFRRLVEVVKEFLRLLLCTTRQPVRCKR